MSSLRVHFAKKNILLNVERNKKNKTDLFRVPLVLLPTSISLSKNDKLMAFMISFWNKFNKIQLNFVTSMLIISVIL